MKTFTIYDPVTGVARIKCTVSETQEAKQQRRPGEAIFTDDFNPRTQIIDVSGSRPVAKLRPPKEP